MSGGAQRKKPVQYLRGVDVQLWRDLRGYCLTHGLKYVDVVQGLIRDWLKKPEPPASG